MGLDQNAWAVEPKVAHLALITERELTDEEMSTLEEGRIHLMTWRKHADLNKWMEDLYVSKGGTGVFNCTPMPLTREDICNLKMHLQVNGNAYEVRGQGFFWGQTREEDIALDHAFIDKALNAIDEGYEVYYYCWW